MEFYVLTEVRAEWKAQWGIDFERCNLSGPKGMSLETLADILKTTFNHFWVENYHFQPKEAIIMSV